MQVFNESDSKLYTNFEYCEEVNHKHFTNMLIYKAKQFRMEKNPQQNLHILEDGASHVQVGDIEQVRDFVFLKSIKLMVFYKVL